MNARLDLTLIVSAMLAGPYAVPELRAADSKPLTRRERGDLAIEARSILRRHCGECHGPQPSRSLLSVLDYKSLVGPGPPVPFVDLNDPARSQVLEFIADGSMPPGGRSGPSAAELAKLKAWVAARAPSYPRAFDETTTLSAMLDDWQKQELDDRRYLRYASFTHLMEDERPLANLSVAEFRLQKALLAASGKRYDPVPVDDTATLFRLDIRALGWDAPDLFDRIVKGRSAPDAYPIIPLDVVMVEYPHAKAQADKEVQDIRLKSFLDATKQLRPVPFIRADWLSEALAPQRLLAADVKGLVDLADALRDHPKQIPCGPPTTPFGSASAQISAPQSGAVLPLSAWYTGDLVPDPDPFGLTVDIVRPLKGNAPTREVEVGEPFRLRIKADKDVRFVVLNVSSTGEIRLQMVDGGDALKRGESRLLGPAPGKPFVCGSLSTGALLEIEHFIVIASEKEVPLPTIIRSRHSDAPDCRKVNAHPIWRFVLDSPEASQSVRKVVPLKISAKER